MHRPRTGFKSQILMACLLEYQQLATVVLPLIQRDLNL